MEEKGIKLSDYFLLFLVIYCSADTLLFGTNADSRFILLSYVILMLSIVFLIRPFSTKLKIAFPKKQLQYFLGMTCFCMLSMLFNFDVSFGYLLKIILLLFALLYSTRYSINDFFKIYEDIIFVICIFSLIGFILMFLNNGVLPTPIITTNTYGRGFYNIGFAISPNYTRQLRNWSFFREPGVFQMYVILGMLIHISRQSKISIVRVIVYTITILTTLSTTGYIALIGVITLIVLRNNSMTSGKKIILISLIAFVIGYVAINTNLLSLDVVNQRQSVFGKFFDMQRGTTISRIGSFYGNIYLFFKNPLFGVGLGGIDKEFLNVVSQKYSVTAAANTNMLLIQFSAHGIFYGCLWTYGMYLFSGHLGRGFERVIVLLTMLVLFSGENVQYGVLPSLLLMYGISLNQIYQEEIV